VSDWQRGLRHAKKALAVVRHDKPGTEQIIAFLMLAYAYWQGGQRSRGIRILLGQLPQILASVYKQQDDSLRHALKVAIEVVSQPLLKALQKLRCLMGLRSNRMPLANILQTPLQAYYKMYK
jgi:hypothetical protein